MPEEVKKIMEKYMVTAPNGVEGVQVTPDMIIDACMTLNRVDLASFMMTIITMLMEGDYSLARQKER